MSNDSVSVLFAPGRVVGGDHTQVVQKKDNKGQPRYYEKGHKKEGQPMMECYVPVAIPKTPNQIALLAQGFKTAWALKPDGWDQNYPGMAYWGEVIWQTAHAGFPKLVNPQTGRIELPTFAWKIEDGDDTTPKGDRQVRNCDRKGYPGCWIVHLKSGQVSKFVQGQALQEIKPEMVKRGWWVVAWGSVAPNGESGKPGVYLNHNAFMYHKPDDEIVFGPDISKANFGAFGSGATIPGAAANFPAVGGLPGQPAGSPLPGGLPVLGAGAGIAQGTTHAGAPAGLPGQPIGGVPGVGMAPAQAPAGVPAGLPGALPASTSLSNGPFVPGAGQGIGPGGATAAGNPTAVQPHPGFLQPAAGLMPAGAPVVPQTPAQPILAPALAAQGVTWAAMAQQGWTVEAARAAGHVVG